MKVQFIAALIAASACVLTTKAEARRSPQGIIACDERGCRDTAQPVVRVATHSRPRSHHRKSIHRHYDGPVRGGVQIVSHPEGCPSRAFCGCGAAIKVFGKNIRELWLAANWFKFPKAEPAPGMVAVRQHHVFVILEVRSGGRVLAYDANSGGHKTRIHERHLAGYSVRNPHGNKMVADAG